MGFVFGQLKSFENGSILEKGPANKVENTYTHTLDICCLNLLLLIYLKYLIMVNFFKCKRLMCYTPLTRNSPGECTPVRILSFKLSGLYLLHQTLAALIQNSWLDEYFNPGSF